MLCKIHGEVNEKDTFMVKTRGYVYQKCRLCQRAWDKKRSLTEKRKAQALLYRNKPEQKEKAKARELKYRERRRFLNNNLYHKKKIDPDYKAKLRVKEKKYYETNKKELNDGYIKKLLRVHKNADQEMIEKKRKEVLNFRILKTRKNIFKEFSQMKKDEKIKEWNEKGIIKSCKIHGLLTINNLYYVFNGKKLKNKIYLCRYCESEESKIYNVKNKEANRERHKRYKENNFEKVLAASRNWAKRLPDAYVKRHLIKYCHFKEEDITKELIDLKRANFKLKRKIREIKYG